MPGLETTVAIKSPQCGEELSHNDDVVPEPQVEISNKSRSTDYSNHGEKTRAMIVQYKLLSLDGIAEKSANIRCAVPSCIKKHAIWGRSCAEAQITAQHAALGNSERRKSAWSGFPKTLECKKLGGCLYNYIAALRAPTFATPSLRLPPCPRAPPFAFTRALPLGLKNLRKEVSSDLDLRDGAKEGRW